MDRYNLDFTDSFMDTGETADDIIIHQFEWINDEKYELEADRDYHQWARSQS